MRQDPRVPIGSFLVPVNKELDSCFNQGVKFRNGIASTEFLLLFGNDLPVVRC